MNDFIWLSNLFTSAATMQNAIPAGAFITANVSIATNEMGGAVVNGGTVTFAAGSVVYAPAQGGNPAAFTSMAVPGTPFYNSLLRLKDSKVFDQITLRIEEPAGNAAPVVVISYVDMFGNPTVGPQAMAGVGSAANVLYGVAPDGIAAANPNGTSALFTIAPFNLQVHH